MYELDKEKARIILVAQQYNASQVDRLLNTYPLLPDSFKPFVEQWLADQVTPDFEVDGVSVKSVMEARQSSFLIAIRDLGRLLDPGFPEDKKKLWKELLTTPVRFA